MAKTGSKRCLQGLEKLERYVVAMRNPTGCFSSIFFYKTIVLFRNEIWRCYEA